MAYRRRPKDVFLRISFRDLLGKAAFVMACLIASANSLAQSSADLMGQRSEAVGYAVSTKFGIGRAARDCRDTLGKDDAYMRGIVDDWLSRNSRYSDAAELWISLVVTYVDHRHGQEEADKLARQMMGAARDNGINAASAMIGASEEDKRSKCKQYPALVHSGAYDINESSPQYKNLQELVSYLQQSSSEE